MARARFHRPSAFLNALFFVFGALSIAYYVAMGVVVRFNQSMAWVWPALGILLILRGIAAAYMRRTGKRPPIPHWATVAFHTALAVGFAWFLFIESFVFFGSFERAPDSVDYIVVLGARVNPDGPSGVLNNRIEYAQARLESDPGCVCIASGGQGEDEHMSEAECIREQLVLRGIDPARILTEDASSSTRENCINSFAMIADPSKTVAIVTNNFHMFRSLRTARESFPEYTIYGISVHTTPISYPHYMMREAFTVTHELAYGVMTLF